MGAPSPFLLYTPDGSKKLLKVVHCGDVIIVGNNLNIWVDLPAEEEDKSKQLQIVEVH